MSELNFSFPIVRDIDATRARHQDKIHKLDWQPSFLNKISDDDLFEAIMYRNHRLFNSYPAQYWREQEGVKEIKGIVNNFVRSLIGDALAGIGKPRSWDTAYYLLHQATIDNRMESVSKLVYAELSDF